MRVLALVATAVSIALFLCVPAAKAAAVRGPVLACRDQADIKRALRPTSDKDAKDNAAYLKGRVGAGECVQLLRDQKVLVDQRDGQLWCVRPSGALDCYWTYEKAIDLYPPPPPEPGEQPGAKKKR
ncbi:MAG: hypothetical protein C3F11_08180 [Methylocystaceae bacterium]|nr:MAG: hypothetical protein C3F11_08180 [Methylocystaceae bacterium]